ncbi:MAG: response regulator [Alphaproteobacteria bacterium]|nr:response regulator [Alphaproteobacteria bacterium]
MKKKEKILVVDDDHFNLDILSRYLGGAHFEVLQADDGDAALQKLTGAPDIAVIVLDLEMPRMHGLALMKEIKKTPALKDIPVIIQTVVDNRKWKTTPGLEDVCGYLVKPYDPELLVDLIRQVLGKP